MKPNSFVKKALNDASLHLFLIVLIGFIIYSKTFNVPFHFDDTSNIIENYKLRDLNNLWTPEGSRWVGFLTFALNYHLGGLNITGYHIVNLVIHIFNAILVYYLVALTLKTPYFKVSVISASVSNQPNQFNLSTFQPLNYLPLFIALLFVSHPIQTQAVTYIVQRFASLATMFYLLSLVMYIKWRLITSQQSAISPQRSAPHPSLPLEGGGQGRGWRLHAARYTLYAISLISAILAMKTKEISFTLPFIIILYEFCFLRPPDSQAAHRRLKPAATHCGYRLRITHYASRLLYLMPFLLTLLIIPLSLISIDKPVGDAIGELREATQETEEIPRWSYLFTQFRVIVTYIRLLFLPINQNVDYDYPIYHSFLNPNVFLSFLFLLSIFGLGVYLFYRSRFRFYGSQSLNFQLSTFNLKLISFGIFWFFITLSVESSIIPIRDVIFEHRLYLPSVGAIIAFSTAVFHVFHRAADQQSNRAVVKGKTAVLLRYCSVALIIIALSIATYQRNTVWQDEMSLWGDVGRKSPLKARGYTNLGAAYGKIGATDEAIKHFNIALILMPDDAEVHSDIGAAYGSKGWTDMAIEHLQTALKLKPDLVSAHNNIGLVYKSKGLIDKSVEHFQIAIKLKPEFADAHNNLGNAYYKKGQFDNAIREYQTALILKPDDTEIQYNLSLVYAIKNAINSDKNRL